jgi:hypothetical protein
MTLLRSEFIAMNERNSAKLLAQQRWTWTPLKAIAAAGVPMEPGVRFSRGQLHSGIDVAAYLDGLAINYPLSVQGSSPAAPARLTLGPQYLRPRKCAAPSKEKCLEERSIGRRDPVAGSPLRVNSGESDPARPPTYVRNAPKADEN